MKKVFCRLLFLQVFLLGCDKGFSQSHKLDSVKLEFEGFFTESIRTISCEDFEHAFLDTKKIKVVNQQPDLVKFELLRKNFEPAKNRAFDVRGKITYYRGAEAIRYCFDTFGYFYNDGKLYHNKELLIAISDNIYSNHPQDLDTLRSQ